VSGADSSKTSENSCEHSTKILSSIQSEEPCGLLSDC